MGVLRCDRLDCENIMCDICVDGKWYICWECRREFDNFIAFTKRPIRDENDFILAIKDFVNTRFGEYRQIDNVDIGAYFNKYSR